MHPRVKGFLLFLLYVVLSQAFGAAFGWLLVVKLHVIDISDRTWHPRVFMIGETIGAAGAALATLLVAKAAGWPLARLGYRRTGALRQLGAGSLFGLTAVVALVLAIAALGGFSFGAVAMSGAKLLKYTVAWLIAFALVGVAEEMDFRAASLFTLAEAIGFWPAAILLSALFGALHYFFKPGENLADAFSVGLLGLFLCFTVMRTGAIWFAIGFHALFDYAAIFLFGAPNSGNQGRPVATKLLTGGYHGAAWLTGGPLGVEASWLVFPVIALLFVGFSLLRYNPATQQSSEEHHEARG